MQYQGVVGPNAIEKMQRLAARHQIVLAERLEPVDVRMRLEDRLIVIGAQTQAESQRGRRVMTSP
jgi:hypothetical protein